jgi:phosphatidate cytidylyltransferase
MADSTTSGGRWATLGARVVTAAVGVPLLVVVVIVGQWPLFVLTWILALVGSAEFSSLLRLRQLDLPVWAIGPLTTGFLGGAVFHWPMWPLVAGLFFLAALFGLGGTDNQRGFITGMGALFGALYLGGLFGYLIRLRALPHGAPATLFVFAVVWCTDAAAYFVGRAYGRHVLLPRVSPGKTWEGSLAGLGAGLAVAAGIFVATGHPLVLGALVGAAVSVAGQIGDLVESNFKRFAGAKDSGAVLPGHGGVLDRFDSALFALPAAYYLLKGLGLG